MAWANTAMNTTMARPIMSAAAVAAVRLGLRPALSRARRPLVGASLSSGQPMMRGRRPHDVLGQHGDGDEEQQRAEAHEEQAAAGRAVGEDAEASEPPPRPAMATAMAVVNLAKRVGGRVAALLQGGHRRHAGRAQGRGKGARAGSRRRRRARR